MPRVKAKKIKIVPILVKRTIDLSEYTDPNSVNCLGRVTRKEIEEEIGRKVYEFAQIRVSHTRPVLKEVSVMVYVVNRDSRNNYE